MREFLPEEKTMEMFLTSVLAMLTGRKMASKPIWSEEPPAFIKEWKALHFPEADEPAWKAWVGYAERDENDLITLLTTDVGNDHKRRALFVLLTPRLTWTPFFWPKNEWAGAHFGSKKIAVKELPPELRTFMLSLILAFGDHLDGMVSDRNYIRHDYERSLRYSYNEYLRAMLTLVPAWQAEQAFKAYELNGFCASAGVFSGISGYGRLRDLWRDPGVPEAWKRRADQLMREQVLGELDGTRQAREPWEDAFWHYMEKVLWAWMDNAYSQELLREQLTFIASMTARKGTRLISFSRFVMFWRELDTDQDCDLRRRLSEFMVKRNGSPFVLSGDDVGRWRTDELRGIPLKEGVAIAREMLDLLKDDPDAVASLKAAIHSAEAEIARNDNEKRRAKTEENTLLTNLR